MRPVKKSLKIFLWSLAALILLLVILAVFTQTAPFRSLVTSLIISQAEKQLHGELLIGSIEGNFYSNLQIRDIALLHENSSLIAISEISLEYDLRYLFRKQLMVNSLEISGLQINLHKYEDEWNFERILPDREPPLEVEEKKGSDWEITVNHFALIESNVFIETENAELQQIPSSLNDLNLSLSFGMRRDWLKLILSESSFNFHWEEGHKINIDKMALTGRMINDSLELELFTLDSDNFLIRAAGQTPASLTSFSGELDFYITQAVDFAYFFPELNPESSFRLSAKVTGEKDLLDVILTIQEDTGKVTLTMNMQNPPYRESDLEPVYDIAMDFSEFTPSYWLADTSLYLLLNGRIDLSGSGFDPYKGAFTLDTDLQNSSFHAYELMDEPFTIAAFQSSGKLSNNSLSADLKLRSEKYGYLETGVNIENLEELEGLSLSGKIEHLDLESLQFIGNPESNLNFSFNVKGEGFPEKPVFIDLEISPSHYNGFNIDHFLFKGVWEDREVLIDTLFCSIDDNILELSGFYSEARENYADFSFSLNNLNPLLSYMELDEEIIATKGVIKGNLHGKQGALSITGKLTLEESRYDTILCGLIENSFQITQKDDFFLIQTDMQVSDILINDFPIEYLTLTANMDRRDTVSASLDVFQSADLSLGIDTTVHFNEELLVRFNRFNLDFEDIIWQLNDRTATLRLYNDNYEISDFILSSGDQSLALQGNISLSKESDFRLEIRKFDLTPLISLLEEFPVSSGLLSLDFSLQGRPHEPYINADIDFSGISFQELSELSGIIAFNYNPVAEKIETLFDLKHKELTLAGLNLSLPASLRIDEGLDIYEDRPFRLNLKTTEIDLALFSDFVEEIRGLSGKTEAEVTLDNTLSDIRANGSFSILDAGFSIPEIGTSYRNLNLLLLLEEDRIKLETLQMRSGQGRLTGQGYLSFVNDLLPTDEQSGIDFTDLSLNLRTENFPLISNQALDLLINSNFRINGSIAEPHLAGNIAIARGRVNIDKLLDYSAFESVERPLLVEAREKLHKPPETLPDIEREALFDLQNLRGEVSLVFPRNFWVRSSDMNIELSGDLSLLIDGDEFELFGSVNTLRGFYIFYGKRFRIESGEILFTGGREIDPLLSLRAVYSFRGADMTRKNLRLILSGTLDQMDIAFELNNQPIEETDAIAYIILGRSFDELTHGERNEVSNQALVIGGFLAHRLTDRITTVVGDTFRFDLIEFRSDTATSQIGVEVGKYLTDNLFFSYKRDFSFSDTQEQASEEILVEYAISRFLYLQALKGDSKATGLDLIWRFKWR